MKYILRISSPDFGKPQKFHLSVFVSTGFGRNDFSSSPEIGTFFSPGKKSHLFSKKNLFFYLTN